MRTPKNIQMLKPVSSHQSSGETQLKMTQLPHQEQEKKVQIGTYSFTFDHVYGSSASQPSSMFEECVAPLVDGLFQGYSATVFAYGQKWLPFREQGSLNRATGSTNMNNQSRYTREYV